MGHLTQEQLALLFLGAMALCSVVTMVLQVSLFLRALSMTPSLPKAPRPVKRESPFDPWTPPADNLMDTVFLNMALNDHPEVFAGDCMCEHKQTIHRCETTPDGINGKRTESLWLACRMPGCDCGVYQQRPKSEEKPV